METEEKYTKEEFFKKLESGEIKLSINQIKGLHGGTYSRDPAFYPSDPEKWFNTEFVVCGKPYKVTTYEDEDGNEWFQLSEFLRAAGLLVQEYSDITNYGKSIHYNLTRHYQPHGKGTKRVFINMEAIKQFGFSDNKEPIIKKKYSFEYTGIVTLNINIEAVEIAFMKMMDKLKTIEERAILCDVHRILKQIQ